LKSGVVWPPTCPVNVTVSICGLKSETVPFNSTCRLPGPLVGLALKLVITGEGQLRASKASRIGRKVLFGADFDFLRGRFNNPHIIVNLL